MGVYFSRIISVCEDGGYSTPFPVQLRAGTVKARLAFQCRLNPKYINVLESKEDYYIAPGSLRPKEKDNPTDPNNISNDSSNYIRPYRIILKALSFTSS